MGTKYQAKASGKMEILQFKKDGLNLVQKKKKKKRERDRQTYRSCPIFAKEIDFIYKKFSQRKLHPSKAKISREL